MQLTIDYSDARLTRSHEYAGLTARIDDGPPVHVVIAADGCRLGGRDEEGVAVGHDVDLEHDQVWTLAFLLTGRESATPVGGAFRDVEARTLSYQLRRSERRRICDLDADASAADAPIL